MCDRAREWTSLELDGELSELERAALETHTRSCDACRAFAAGVADVASTLRSTPFVEPEPLAVPSARRRVRPVFVVAAALVVALAAGAGSLVGTLSSRGGPSRPGHADAAAQKPFIEQQLLALANGVAEPQRGRSSGRVIAS
jgi:anti-sigma factor RsiW